VASERSPRDPREGALAGRRALITGAGRGIGRAIALAFAGAGADLVLVARSPAELEAVAAEARACGVRAVVLQCDVTDADQVAGLLAAASAALDGPPAILVNNAGAGASHKFLGHDDAIWHRLLAANLTSVYYVTKAIVPALVEQGGGRIINIASIAAKVGAKYLAAYTASKHGVLGLTRALAVELRPYGITVNAICPGYVNTPMTDTTVGNISARSRITQDEARRAVAGLNAHNRLIAPEEVAHVALMLAADAAGSITGQAINVDGGTVMF
jgi:NAD(P)-dependent dehydrogenase (short-subunit alcohol dehydrogenase family)